MVSEILLILFLAPIALIAGLFLASLAIAGIAYLVTGKDL